MSLMYTFKCIYPNGDQYCHPCEGAYQITTQESQYQQVGSNGPAMCAVVHDVEKALHFGTDTYVAIYIENPDGKTVNRVHATRAPEPFAGVEGGVQ